MDPFRSGGAARVRRCGDRARASTAARRRADPSLVGGGGALSLRAHRAAAPRAGPPGPLAVLGPRRRRGDVPAVPCSRVSRRRDLPARTRHRTDARARFRRVRGDRLELPDALPRQLRRDTIVRARAGVSPAPGSAARLELRVFVAEPARESAYFCPRSFLICSCSLASSASRSARRFRSRSTTAAGARSTNEALASLAFDFTISSLTRFASFELR